ncbi:MAG TPA: hypothetical protein VIO15_00795 [Bacteroidales bacterium]
MSILNTITSGATGLIKAVGEAIDRNVTNQGEKLALYNELQKILNENEKELTARHAADMASDSWLSKNVRPLTLITLLLLYLLFALFDAINAVHIAKAYIDMLEELTMLVMAFYFGSRGIEKVSRNIKIGKK